MGQREQTHMKVRTSSLTEKSSVVVKLPSWLLGHSFIIHYIWEPPTEDGRKTIWTFACHNNPAWPQVATIVILLLTCTYVWTKPPTSQEKKKKKSENKWKNKWIVGIALKYFVLPCLTLNKRWIGMSTGSIILYTLNSASNIPANISIMCVPGFESCWGFWIQ